MNRPIHPTQRMRILFVEDLPDDYMLAEHALRKEGLAFTSMCVDTQTAFESALREFQPDLVISDYTMPQFDGLRALRVSLERDAALPFIVLTGSLNEETAVQCMKAGATDYVLKERITRLPFAVKEALDQKAVREAKDAAERALRESNEKLRLVIENTRDMIFVVDRQYRLATCNQAYQDALRASGGLEMAIGDSVLPLEYPPAFIERWHAIYERALGGELFIVDSELAWRDGMHHFENTLCPLRDADGDVMGALVVSHDITDRKRRERELEAIAGTATALRAATTRAEMVPIIVDQVRDLLQADGVMLVIADVEAGDAVVALGRGCGTEWTGRRFPRGEGIAGCVMSTGQPYATNDAGHDPHTGPMDHTAMIGAIGCVPLIARDQIIGVLWAGRQAAIAADDMRLLMLIGGMAANALQRAQLVETLEQRVADRTRELADANVRLQELDRLKSKFISDVSHELRTPMTTLGLSVDLLVRGKPEKREQYLQVLQQQTRRLAQLMEDVLDLSRLELGTDNQRFAPVALNLLVEQVVDIHQSSAEARNVVLSFAPYPDLPAVLGVENQIAQVVNNLIDNAINYTPAGQVQVSTRLAGQDAVIEVQDTGQGIASEDLPHVFERFYRSHRALHIRGTGLGLAIAKEIVDVHGGRIEVESEVGAGSTFRVYLPIHAVR